MDTKQITPGTRSYNIERVTPELFREHAGQFLYMLQEYFKSSADKSSNPIESFNTTREKLSTDDRFFMVAPTECGIPIGFLVADITRGMARIVIGYVHQSVKPATKNVIIDDALTHFEAWAREKGCKSEIFYTYRAPGAHKLMIKRGWEYGMSVYKKEL